MSYSDSKEYRKKYREENQERLLEQSRARYKNNEKSYTYYMWKRAEARAKKSGLEFNITVDDIVIPELCPILGVPFEKGSGKGPKPFSPSLDKIDPSKGYVKGNVIVISMRANQIKSNATLDEIVKVCQYLQECKTTK